MGYLLKEALKSICGVNQWSYAVFWKIGCQNSKLLIWEDCYYEVMPCSVLNQLGTHVGERVDLLVKKMMANQVHVVGEGLIGRTAFTGNHQWLVSGHFNGTIHPPEVVNEVQLQFSSGMQTVAVIPALPHGVIQLGSSLAIMENTGFIRDVKSLILHLGSIPSALVSDNYIQDASTERSRMPITQAAPASSDPYGNAKKLNYSTAFDGAFHTNLFQDFQPGNQASLSLSSKVDNVTTSTYHLHNRNVPSEGNECQSSRILEADSGLSLKGQLENRVPRAEVMIPFKPDSYLNCQTSYDPGEGYEECIQHTTVSGGVLQPHFRGQFSEPYGGWTSGAQAVNFSTEIADGLPVVGDQPIGIGVSPGYLHPEDDMRISEYIPDKHGEKDLYEGLNIALSKGRDHVPSSAFLTDFNKIHDGSEVPSCETALSEISSAAQGDLFDVLGMDYKNKILNGYAGKVSDTAAGENMNNQMKPQVLTSVVYPNNHRISGCGKFLESGSDHLLDAMVSGVHSAATQTSDDNLSCKTTLTKASCSSAPSSSLMFGQGSISEQMCELFGPTKTLVRSSEIGTNLAVSSSGKNDTGNCSQTSSFYGSQSSSWVEQGTSVKHETSIATAISKKFGEVGKPTRKRLKPGENPRPRPKDRQMIQDRVKELRELVPNGSKCSIDALLERTIKHMLFLQSVSQHADKLKHTVESKIINKDGGLLLKDNFEGGATWAYEVGSQANVCPIVVEDLNAPRQLLVEMLCEERGFFLEIADIIRGMGLTILKGVMETRHDKIWARFAVEANRDVTRVEVFLSLVHLLEQTGKIDSNPQKDDSNSANRIAHSTFSTQTPYQETT